MDRRHCVRGWMTGCLIGIVMFNSASVQAVRAEEVESGQDSPMSFSLALRQDTFFGFQVQATGTYALTDHVALAFYGIHWTDVRGIDTGVGGNPWTEVGAGLELSYLDKTLKITPMLGTLHGQLLSRGPGGAGATFNNAGRPTAFEGIVPNLTMDFDNGRLEGQIYAGYYKALRNEAPTVGVGTWDFLHYWASGGVRVHRNVSIGAHWEELRATRIDGGTSGVLYQWLGPYIEVKLPGSIAFRFTGGPDLHRNADFYKLSFTKTF